MQNSFTHPASLLRHFTRREIQHNKKNSTIPQDKKGDMGKSPSASTDLELDLLDGKKLHLAVAVIFIRSGAAGNLNETEGMYPHPSPARQSRLPHYLYRIKSAPPVYPWQLPAIQRCCGLAVKPDYFPRNPSSTASPQTPGYSRHGGSGSRGSRRAPRRRW